MPLFLLISSATNPDHFRLLRLHQEISQVCGKLYSLSLQVLRVEFHPDVILSQFFSQGRLIDLF